MAMSVCSLKGRKELVQRQGHQSGSAAVKADSAAPCKNGKATNSAPDQTKLKKKVFQQKQVQQKPNESVWGTMNKYAYQPKFQPPQQSLTSCFVLRNNNSGKVVAKYVANEANIYRILLFGFLNFL
jgi:hypothetical protein